MELTQAQLNAVWEFTLLIPRPQKWACFWGQGENKTFTTGSWRTQKGFLPPHRVYHITGCTVAERAAKPDVFPKLHLGWDSATQQRLIQRSEKETPQEAAHRLFHFRNKSLPIPISICWSQLVPWRTWRRQLPKTLVLLILLLALWYLGYPQKQSECVCIQRSSWPWYFVAKNCTTLI